MGFDAMDPDVPTVTVQDDDAEISALIRQLQLAVITHPEASRAVFAALVTEGRRFAQTPTGAAWRARLQRSSLISRATPVWQTATLNALEGEGVTPPSSFVDAIMMSASAEHRDQLLEALFRQSSSEAPDGKP